MTEAEVQPSLGADPSRSFFHPIEDTEGTATYHLISVESLARLSPENPRLATGVIRSLGRLGPTLTDELKRELFKRGLQLAAEESEAEFYDASL